jgi:nucleotide-binding universal stress UspA family protein
MHDVRQVTPRQVPTDPPPFIIMKATLRRILLPVDPSVFAEAAADTARLIAKAHHAQITAVAVLDSDEIRASLIPTIGPYYPMMVEEVQRKIKHADHILRECLARFAATCDATGVNHRETEYEGIPAMKLLDSAIFYDLVVTGLETSFHFETRGTRGESLHHLLDRTATPVLAVPATGLAKIERVLVAFDGSAPAARALHDFMALAAAFQPEIVLVTAALPREKSDFLLSNAELLLRAHGFGRLSRHAAEGQVEDVFDDLLGTEGEGADLIVLGIQSGSRLKKLFVGSFTKKLIEQGDTPLFMSH